MSEPIPDVQYGKGNWTDYVHNWREKDAEYIQARTILRYQTRSAADADNAGAGIGQFYFNATDGVLEVKGAGSGLSSWIPYKAMPINLTKTADDGSTVSISHASAGGKGVNFTSTGVGVNGNFSVLTSVFTVDATGITIKTGAATAKLTTDGTHLLSDKPISAPSISLSGTGTVLSAPAKTIVAGSVNADAATITNISMSGTLTGGVLNGSGGTIAGVAHGGAGVLANSVQAAGGLISSGGYFHGDASNAFVKYRNPSGGAIGASYMLVDANNTSFIGDNASVYMHNTLRIMKAHGIPWHNAAGTHVAWGGIIIHSGADPGAANFPDGTLWIS